MSTSQLTSSQKESLTALAETSNEKLESASQGATSRAFNLGCAVTLTPGLILVALVFILSDANWSMTAIVAVLVLFAVIVFANLAAYTAQTRTAQRTFQSEIQPEIERTLKDQDLSEEDFSLLANETLPPSAKLLSFITPKESAVENQVT